MTAIGYYNPFQYPVSFTGSKGNMVEVRPGSPVTDKDGYLIKASDVLDKQVQDGILKRIYDTHPDFRDHDKKVKKKKGVSRMTSKQIDRLPVAEASKLGEKVNQKEVKQPKPPEVLIDAKAGVVGLGGKLPEGAELAEDGSVSYRNKKFASVAALKAYITNAGVSATSPSPISKPATAE